MSVNGIGNNNSSYQKISSGKNINNSSDGASELTISENMNSQINGLTKAVDNAFYSENLLKVAEGGAESISEQLQRLKELAIQASSGTLTKGDKQNIQLEIDQIKEGITDIAKNTNYNSINLLDGSFANKNTASDKNGNGSNISIDGIGLEQLGLEKFSVLEDFNINDIDKALEIVSGVRSKIGAITNGLESNIRYNGIEIENTMDSLSKIADSDIAKEIMNLNNSKIIEQYKLSIQKKKQEEEQKKLNMIL